MTKLTVENVRSFDRKSELAIKPLTLLVGENSTGKSTIMSLLAIISDEGNFPFNSDFNIPPFDLGSYDTIATYKGGRYGRASEFRFGFRQETKSKVSKEVEATFVNKYGNPVLKHIKIESEIGLIDLNFSKTDLVVKGKISLRASKKRGSKKIDFNIDQKILKEGSESIADSLTISILRDITRREGANDLDFNILDSLFLLIRGLTPFKTTSIAPIRTKPKRTYDKSLDNYIPEGDHIPYMLANLFAEEEKKEKRESIMKFLEEFGFESGLFKTLRVKRLGKKNTDPFQVNVNASGRMANLLDVGYGVSQALPVVVQTILNEKSNVILLQQPEVHLHPRAQAALGSFFSRQVSNQKKRMVIETHSDYLIDRIRVEVARGNISHKDISIVFFEKKDFSSVIHELSLDKNGNVIKAPECYREFFLNEELKLLTRTKH